MLNADQALKEVPVDNTSAEYSSQIWVFDALDVLYDMELFPDQHFYEAHAMLSHLHYDGVDEN